jgi:hypothetical protein
MRRKGTPIGPYGSDLDFSVPLASAYYIIKKDSKEFVCTNLMVQVSRIPGHEIRIVSYALWDGGDCLLY